MTNSYLGIIFALLSTASWAACTMLFKKLGERLDPVGMTTVKAVLSAIFLLIIVLLSGHPLLIETKYIYPIAVSGILGISIGDSLFFASLGRLSPLALSLIMFVFPDFFSGLFGLIFLKEMPSLLSWVGIFAILGGLAFFIFPIEKNSDETKTKLFGVILALLSLICTSYSMVLIKPILSVVPAVTVTMYRMFFSAVVLALFALFSGKFSVWKNLLKEKDYNLKLSGTILLATVGGFWLSLLAIKYCQLIIASSLMSLEPLFILLFMIIFCRYVPKKKEYFGIFFIILGIIFIVLG
ncbi:MAG: DMT family transporter [Candidatus Gastranaerophilales bacterium]|nr:DMT family transporter [Candidatus Gastranaerophilales bacterium]